MLSTTKHSVFRPVITAAAVMSAFLSSCRAGNTSYAVDEAAFANSAHHWYDIYDKDNVINAEPNQPRYEAGQITEIADNVLLYQKNNGGWPKNYDMFAILTESQKEKLLSVKDDVNTTFDNSTTYSHIRRLAKVYAATGIEKYKQACLRGIDFTLAAQYANGGWPQYFPLRDDYSRRITFNDDVMAGIMEMLKEIADNEPHFGFVDAERRERAGRAFEKGLDCILKCQIKDNGTLTAWGQQHDENDLSPAWARAYEPPSICNRESAGVVLFLMSPEKPSPEVVNAVKSAAAWFEASKITGVRLEVFETPPVKFPLRTLTTDCRIVEDESAPPIWARFYELKTHRPLFSNRQSELLYSLAEVDRERRAYGWYTDRPQEVLDTYPGWLKKVTGGN